jgi:RNase P/RNase MRP subunit POP5
LDSDGLPSGKELIDTIWGAVTKLYGEHGASQTSLALIDYDLENKTAVLRTSLATLDLVRASLATITSVAGSEALTKSSVAREVRKTAVLFSKS